MKKNLLLPLAALLMATMACQTILDPITDSSELDPFGEGGTSATESIFGEEATEPSNQGDGRVLLEDDFSNPASGWEVGDYESGSVGYTSDAYSVISLGESDFMWGVAFREFDDVVIEVEATQVRAPGNDNNAYGVMCRVQDNGDGYMLRISGDGFYAIHKWSNDELVSLVDWTTSDVIRLGNSTNRIRATCDGPQLILEVNGQQLATAQDPTEVHFDNLVVTAP